MIRHLGLLILAALLSACATIATYDIDEAAIEQQLQKAVHDFDQQQAAQDLPLSLRLDDVHITVGPDDREVIAVSAKGQAAINAVITRIPVDIFLKVEGTPVYSGKDKAVYIKRLTLLDGDVKSPLFNGDSKPVTQGLMAVLSQLLETTPVYRLNESNPRERLLASMPIDIKVGRGKLRIVPQGD